MKCPNTLDLDEYTQNTWNNEYNQEMAAVHTLFIYFICFATLFSSYIVQGNYYLAYDVNCLHYKGKGGEETKERVTNSVMKGSGNLS